MEQALVTNSVPPRPDRAQIEPAALELLSRHSAGLLATARRYSLTPEDAEDAYQRGMEILLTKAPTTREDELLPWLNTVVKHEAFAVRRSSARALPSATPDHGESEISWTDERAERFERLRVGAEAMSNLKPQEIRCLLLRAEGLSYQEICNATGWTYTKVNRCITEGRRAFLKRVASIESGAECDRLAPLVSKVADGEASADELRRVRPHVKGCLACKARLREYRATPARVAALVPPVFVLGGGNVGWLSRVAAALHARFAGIAGTATVQKGAAVAASVAVLAGGGAAGLDAIHHDAPAVGRDVFGGQPASTPATPSVRQQLAVTTPAPAAADPAPAAPAASTFVTQPTASAAPPAPTADPEPEFDPGTAASVGGSAAPTQTAAIKRRPSNESSAAPGASGEFGP